MVSATRWNHYSKIYNFFMRAANHLRWQQFKLLDQQQIWQASPQNIYIAGAGTGLDLPYLATRVATGSKIHLVDFSADMLAQAQRLIERQAFRFSVSSQIGRAEISGLAAQSCDLVILHLILAVTSTPEELLAETVRVLKPNGVISLWDKFLPDGQQPEFCRRTADKITTALGTTINLRLQDLIEPLPLVIERRRFCHFGLMQQLILRKQGD